MTLGHLIWWSVSGQASITLDALDSVLADTGVPVPSRPLPIDVFRRLTGEAKKTYPLEIHTLEITVAKVESKTDSMLVRHMVGTVKSNAGVVQTVRKLGDVAFYKPPRGQQSKARMRVLPDAEWPHETADFVAYLHAEYRRGVQGTVDAQGIRRVVRNYLANQGAIYLDGPYFITSDAPYEALRPLFGLLGKDSNVHVVPLPDTPEQQAWLAEHTIEVTT